MVAAYAPLPAMSSPFVFVPSSFRETSQSARVLSQSPGPEVRTSPETQAVDCIKAFAPGHSVSALYAGDGSYYAASVCEQGDDGSVTVDWDDGDQDFRIVPVAQVQPRRAVGKRSVYVRDTGNQLFEYFNQRERHVIIKSTPNTRRKAPHLIGTAQLLSPYESDTYPPVYQAGDDPSPLYREDFEKVQAPHSCCWGRYRKGCICPALVLCTFSIAALVIGIQQRQQPLLVAGAATMCLFALLAIGVCFPCGCGSGLIGCCLPWGPDGKPTFATATRRQVLSNPHRNQQWDAEALKWVPRYDSSGQPMTDLTNPEYERAVAEEAACGDDGTGFFDDRNCWGNDSEMSNGCSESI